MWGVKTTLSLSISLLLSAICFHASGFVFWWRSSFSSLIRISPSITSKPAPASLLLLSAFSNAVVSTISPLDVLIKIEPFFICLIVLKLIKCLVCFSRGTWRVTMSDFFSRLLRGVYLNFNFLARDLFLWGSYARTSMLKPLAILITCSPILPTPITPSVLPSRSNPFSPSIVKSFLSVLM